MSGHGDYELFGAGRPDIPAPGVVADDYDEVRAMPERGAPDAASARHRPPPARRFVRLSAVLRPGEADVFSYPVSDSGGASGNIAGVQISP